MISWIWVVIAFVVGQIVGFICAALCSGSWDAAEERAKERKRLQAYDTYVAGEILRGLPPETMSFSVTTKKAADAGTSTAAQNEQKG